MALIRHSTPRPHLLYGLSLAATPSSHLASPPLYLTLPRFLRPLDIPLAVRFPCLRPLSTVILSFLVTIFLLNQLGLRYNPSNPKLTFLAFHPGLASGIHQITLSPSSIHFLTFTPRSRYLTCPPINHPSILGISTRKVLLIFLLQMNSMIHHLPSATIPRATFYRGATIH